MVRLALGFVLGVLFIAGAYLSIKALPDDPEWAARVPWNPLTGFLTPRQSIATAFYAFYFFGGLLVVTCPILMLARL